MKKSTIIQFSDMHTSSIFPSNKTFVSSIISDIERQKTEDPQISKPNILVVCGDIVEGINKESDTKVASRKTMEQYNKAEAILNSLCEKFFYGEKNNIVVVPGNHDVSWSHSRKSMEKIINQGNLTRILKLPESNYRWDWDEQSYYKISDLELYDRRFELFSKFYKSFYEGNRIYPLNPQEQFDIFEYPEENIIIVGFNSCFRNDHLNDIGSINPECIADCYERINQKKFIDWVKIAVWHHDIHGSPLRSDFMDDKTLQFLIDKGFHIGLHGHHHKSDVFEVRFNPDETMKMNVFSCGSLGAERGSISLGEGRQYGLIELNKDDLHVRFSLRKALDQPPQLPIWMPGNIRQNRDKSYIDGVLSSNIGNREKMTTTLTKDLAEVNMLISKKDYSLALEKLTLLDISNPFVRRLLIECYWQMDRYPELIKVIGKPASLIEFTYLTEALWREKAFFALKELIEKTKKDKNFASSPIFERIMKKMKDAGYG